MVTFGVSMPTFCGGGYGRNYMSLEELRDWVQTCERLGFTSLWHVDRLGCPAPPGYNTSWYEPLITLSTIIPFTKSIRVGTSIINITYRPPVILAKQLATLDRISGGRLSVGVGQGWVRDELKACGIDIRERTLRFEEGIDLLKKLLEEEKVSYDGKFWKLKDFCLEPRPVQNPRPPILIAGGGNGIHFDKRRITQEIQKRIFERIARMGDGWIIRTDTSLEEIAAGIKEIKSHLSRMNKKIDDFHFIHQNFVFVIGKCGTISDAIERFKGIVLKPFDFIKSRYIVGDPDYVRQRVKAEVDIGIKHFIVMPVGVDYEVLHFFAEEIIPEFVH
jgi:probable F420-dependent oxidoreductase